MSAANDADIANGNLKFTVTLGADATGFTVTTATVNGGAVTPNTTGNVITFVGLTHNDVVNLTIASVGHTSITDSKTYTVA